MGLNVLIERTKKDILVRVIYYWVHHTGCYDGNSGVQRVVRALAGALAEMTGVELVPVRWCNHREAIVYAEQAWIDGLARYGGPRLVEPAEAGVPIHLGRAEGQRHRGAWLIIPEVTHLEGPHGLPAPALPVVLDYARYYGLRTAAVFYDLIPLLEPGYEELTAAHTAYTAALAAVDVILPISRAAGVDLVTWWRERGYNVDRLPPIRPVLLAAEMAGVQRVIAPDAVTEASDAAEEAYSAVRFLAVGTVEPRKNQLKLMQAFDRLVRRRPELDIQLDVVGALHPAIAAAVQKEASRSQGCIRLHQYASDAALHALMRDCDATVFVSLAEGFGLPIVESLWHGKPCLCSNVGSMAEIAADGGCLRVDPHDSDAIERSLERLAEDAALRAELARAACSRPLALWKHYAQTVLAMLDGVSPVSLLAVVEGSRGGGKALATDLEAAGARVWEHHWRADTQAILPGFRENSDTVLDVGPAIYGTSGRSCRSPPQTDPPRRCASKTKGMGWG